MTAQSIYYYWHSLHNGKVVSLVPEARGRYKIIYENDSLGSYHSAEAALDDLCGGHVFSASGNVDFSQMNIPDSLNDWEKRLFKEISSPL
ncbi:MAG: hypothetical protein JKY71_07190 [Alphaproteobacteria bacterium]|nr:hypothetical protein [Alphaproteobacteria bacterium]